MKKVIFVSLVFLLTSCSMSNKEKEKYRPEKYFSEQQVLVAEAVYNGEEKQLEKLLKMGLDVNKPGKQGLTYLLYAIKVNNYAVTEILLEQGADPNFLAYYVIPSDKIVKDEWDDEPIRTLPLETCCGASYPIKYMKLLVKYGANLNDNRTELPLHVAIMADDMEKVKYLLANGADINQLERSSTPIMTAAKIMSWHMMDYLLDRGADVFHVNRNGYTVGLYMQEYINRDAWTPDGRKRIEGLINRLKEKGVKFPVTKQTPTPIEPVSQVGKTSPTDESSRPTGQSSAKPHSWILDDDDDLITS